MTAGKNVVVAGAGGNIGSHLVPHLGRIPGLARVTLIDDGTYELANLGTQDITPADIGYPKATVQARRLRRINRLLEVFVLAEPVERLPLGRLHGDVILSCLDSRRSRQYLNEAAWRLGVPWIDAGVDGGSLLARVNGYSPLANGACLECAWDERDYGLLEQAYPCGTLSLGNSHEPNADARLEAPATNAPSSLGALAAAMQAIECEKLLTGQHDRVAFGRQVLIDASHHRHHVTAFRRNPCCRLADHTVWDIRRLTVGSGELTLAEAFDLGPDDSRDCVLTVHGKRFATRLTCPACGWTRSLLRLTATLSAARRPCRRCRERMVAAGFDLLEGLEASGLPRSVLRKSLASLGLRPGEVFTVRNAGCEAHFELSVTGRDRDSAVAPNWPTPKAFRPRVTGDEDQSSDPAKNHVL